MKAVASLLALAAILAPLAACDSTGEAETPEVAARKAGCMQLEAHVIRISPQVASQFAGLSEADAQAAAFRMATEIVPTEDIEQCAAGEPEIVACMKTAPDVAAIKECIPPGKVIECLQKTKDPAARRDCFKLYVKPARTVW